MSPTPYQRPKYRSKYRPNQKEPSPMQFSYNIVQGPRDCCTPHYLVGQKVNQITGQPTGEFHIDRIGGMDSILDTARQFLANEGSFSLEGHPDYFLESAPGRRWLMENAIVAAAELHALYEEYIRAKAPPETPTPEERSPLLS